jgi:hypothetical protein
MANQDFSEHLLTDELPAEAIDELVGVAGPDSGSTLVMVELRHIGGALARSGPDHGALDALPGKFAMFSLGAIMDPAMGPPTTSQLCRVREALEPWKAGFYFNFTESTCPPSAFYGADAYARLRAIRGEWDPDGRIVANHRVKGEA